MSIWSSGSGRFASMRIVAVPGLFALFFLVLSLSTPVQGKELRCGLVAEFSEHVIDLGSGKCVGDASGHHVSLRNHLGAGYIEFVAGPDVVSQETTCEGEGCGETTRDHAGCWAILEQGDCWIVHTFSDRTRIGRLSIYIYSSQTVVDTYGLHYQAKDVEPPRIVAVHDLAEAVNGAFEVLMEFSEAVEIAQGMDPIRVENGSVATISAVTARQLKAQILPDGGGDISIRLAADAITDRAGNPMVEGDTYTVAYDPLPPGADFSEGPRTHDGYNPVRVRLSFSEAVTDVNPDSLEVLNGLLTRFEVVDRQRVEIEIVPVDDGDMLISVPAGRVRDMAGNPNAAIPEMRIAGIGPRFARQIIADYYKAVAMQHVDLNSRLLAFSEIAPVDSEYADDPTLRIENAFAAPHSIVAFLSETPGSAPETEGEESATPEPAVPLAERFGGAVLPASQTHDKRLQDAFMLDDDASSVSFTFLIAEAGGPVANDK